MGLNTVDRERTEYRRNNHMDQIKTINKKYIICPNCKKSMSRNAPCPRCGYFGRRI